MSDTPLDPNNPQDLKAILERAGFRPCDTMVQHVGGNISTGIQTVEIGAEHKPEQPK